MLYEYCSNEFSSGTSFAVRQRSSSAHTALLYRGADKSLAWNILRSKRAQFICADGTIVLGDNKSLARPRSKQSNVSVRMA